jgi:hypothetical protein
LGTCTAEGLAAHWPANDRGRVTVLCDVEGAEGEIIDPARVPGLRNARVVSLGVV